ncbi:hypothetical protein PM082_006354 [Marasmius tenuissimus]|nr:hypothetical protein PM082_006354 [Marasmius tenuissimus]
MAHQSLVPISSAFDGLKEEYVGNTERDDTLTLRRGYSSFFELRLPIHVHKALIIACFFGLPISTRPEFKRQVLNVPFSFIYQPSSLAGKRVVPPTGISYSFNRAQLNHRMPAQTPRFSTTGTKHFSWKSMNK